MVVVVVMVMVVVMVVVVVVNNKNKNIDNSNNKIIKYDIPYSGKFLQVQIVTTKMPLIFIFPIFIFTSARIIIYHTN